MALDLGASLWESILFLLLNETKLSMKNKSSPCILISLKYYNKKIPQAEWLINKNLFSTVLEAKNLRSRCQNSKK